MIKSIFLGVLAFFTCISVNAQEASTKQKSNTVAYKASHSDCRLNGSFGIKLSIITHEISNEKITHDQTDYIQFDEDGKYTSMINGVTSLGVWKYNYENHSVTVNCGGTNTYALVHNGISLEFTSNGELIRLASVK